MKKIIFGIFMVIITAIAFYIVCPKYEFYQFSETIDGSTVIYRFNKITGKLEERRDGDRKWSPAISYAPLKKP